MKKILSALILLGLLSLPMIIALETLAQVVTPPRGDVQAQTIHPIVALKAIVDWVFYILLIFAGLMIVVAAFYFVTAAGDTEKVKTARNFVLYAIIGVLVAFLARGLVWFAGKIIGIEVAPY